jgi:hypothetical protein
MKCYSNSCLPWERMELIHFKVYFSRTPDLAKVHRQTGLKASRGGPASLRRGAAVAKMRRDQRHSRSEETVPH